MEKNHGLASMTEHQRVILHGRIEEEGILQPGLRISQIILKKKIVCTHLAVNIATNGTTLSAVTVISTLVRKVRCLRR